MNPFEMVVMIVAIVAVAGVLRARFQSAPRDDGASATEATENARLRDDIKALKARVATLERIATDRSTRLDHEIEALRDRD